MSIPDSECLYEVVRLVSSLCACLLIIKLGVHGDVFWCRNGWEVISLCVCCVCV